MSAANHCRLSCMSGARDDGVRSIGRNWCWRKVETQNFASPDFICVFDIGVFRVDWVCNGLLVRRKILRLYKAGAL